MRFICPHDMYCYYLYSKEPTGDVVITKQPPSSLTIHYNETFELECNAMSRSGMKLTYKWIRTKPGTGMCLCAVCM